MSDSDLPVTGTVEDTSLSNRQGDEAIGNLLDNLGTDLVEAEEQAQAPDALAAPSPDEGESDDDGLVIDDDSEAEVSDSPDEEESSLGRFVADDAKVKLEDGSTITVGKLRARVTELRREFTAKTEAAARASEATAARESQLTETANLVAQQREVILTLAKELLPQEPVIPTDPNDPVAYIEYRRDKDLWDQKMGKLQGLWQAKQQEEAKLTEKQQAQFADLKKVEFEKLTTAIPSLKDGKRLEQFRTEAIEIGSSTYGLTAEEIGNVVDHRLIRVLADAVAYRKAIAKRDAGKGNTPQPNNQQPRIIQKQRMANTPQQRDANNALERLRNTGSARDAEAALMKFIT
jgi:hypothetical protein